MTSTTSQRRRRAMNVLLLLLVIQHSTSAFQIASTSSRASLLSNTQPVTPLNSISFHHTADTQRRKYDSINPSLYKRSTASHITGPSTHHHDRLTHPRLSFTSLQMTSSSSSSSSCSPVMESLDSSQQQQQLKEINGSKSTETQLQQNEQPITVTPEPLLSPYAAQTLDGRLLCSTQCAYEIKNPYFRGASYRPTTTLKRITRGVNSCIIGHTTDGISIAFRRSQSQTNSLLDWLQNAALFLTEIDESKYKVSGKIHTGFFRSTKSLWKPLKNILKEMVTEAEENGWSSDIYLTGHGKGGAMASIASMFIKRSNSLPDPKYVCTFASARVGDSQFRDAFNERVVNQTSYEAYLDLVPFLPPSSDVLESMNPSMLEMMDGVLWSESSSNRKENYVWDYQTLGTRKYIDQHGNIVDDVNKELDQDRMKEIEQKTELTWEAFNPAHCSGCLDDTCGGVYFSSVAGDICNDDVCDAPEEDKGKEAPSTSE